MRRNHGFTLLEVLVTMLVVSFALLGIAGILANSLKNDQSAYSRTQAVLLGVDIVDRMRANRTTAEASPSPYNLEIGSSPSTSGVPQTDLTEWRAALAAALPAGTGRVNRDAVTGKVTVVVQWDDSRAAAGTGSSTQQATIETKL
jgi:type IV pilus assembly protein PilV